MNHKQGTILLEPHDPLIFRDGRSFGPDSGNRMKAHKWVSAQSLAGALRSFLGYRSGGFAEENLKQLKEVSITGPLPYFEERLFFPSPADLVWEEFGQEKKYHRLLPQNIGDKQGCNLPDAHLFPVMIQNPPNNDFKPSKDVPAWWSLDTMASWLIGDDVFKDELDDKKNRFLKALELEDRVHVKIDGCSGTAEESMLFTTCGACFAHKTESGGLEPVKIAVNYQTESEAFAKILQNCDELSVVGGERRLAHWNRVADDAPINRMWECPESVATALNSLKEGDGVRMLLATPAYFSKGWLPNWLDSNLCGFPERDSGLSLRLVGISCGRCEYMSGWSYEKSTFGPKESRRVVPAGSVYFFVLDKGNR